MKNDEMANCVYKVQMYVTCSENDALSMQKMLAQTVFEGFEFKSENAVFGVSVEPDKPSEYDYVMALCMVELSEGFNIQQIGKLLSILPSDKKYVNIEFNAGNTSAYGFVSAEYYELHNYAGTFFNNKILEDMALESPDGIYETPDGQKFYMGYFND